jgi:CheY-like chemotaxis protein
MRLLIVEDSPLVRRVHGLAFYRRDHELVEAENGRHALELLAAAPAPFDVILLDLQMPDMNGIEFIDAVHRRPLFKTPIIVTTAGRRPRTCCCRREPGRWPRF